MSTYVQDLGNKYAINGSYQPTHSTARKADNTSLDMTDFLQLMIVQLQSQTIDNTMDTSDMLNQMVQMQMITAMTNMTDASVMGYASSLVGKEVTVGVYNGTKLEEKVIQVMGTGTANGEQVIFSTDGDAYKLSDIMAVGRLPEIKDPEDPDKPADGDDKPVDGPEDTDKPDNTDKPENSDKPEGTDPTDPNPPAENPSEPEDDGPRGEVDPEKDPEAYASAVGKR